MMATVTTPPPTTTMMIPRGDSPLLIIDTTAAAPPGNTPPSPIADTPAQGTVSPAVVPISLALRPSSSKQPHSIGALLHPPHTEEQECPILHEPIATIAFDTMPRPFDAAFPGHTAITLSPGCSHTFHAMALIYHWARNRCVLCPVCRAGPKDRQLSLRKLPQEWRYSLAARVRRQRRRDLEEAEEEDRQTAMQMAARQHTHPIILTVSPMFVELRLEVLSQINMHDLMTPLPLSWTVSSNPTRLEGGSIIFRVPPDELRHIPYPMGTLMRITPRTNQVLQPLQPSAWFVAGTEAHPGRGFHLHCDHEGFHHIHYTMSDMAYESMMIDALIEHDVLVAVPAPHLAPQPGAT